MKKIIGITAAVIMFLSANLSVSAAGLADVFSAEYYADTYEDLKAAFGYEEDDLLEHFLTFGLSEKRVMNPVFDVVAYREKYADLEAAFGDDWDAYVEHWFTYGINEGRDNGTDFDVKQYLAAYDDVAAAYGEDWEAVVEHYLVFGIAEGRDAGFEVPVAPVVSAPVVSAPAAQTPAVTYTVENEYDDDGRVVLATYKNSDGSIAYSITYSYYEDGTKMSESKFDADGNWISDRSWHNNGKLEKEQVYDSTGSFVMMETQYDENGKLLRKMECWSSGSPKYQYVFNESDGTADEISFYENGNQQEYTYWNADGKITQYRTHYENSVINTQIYYYEDGTKKEESKFTAENGFISYRTWYSNGQLQREQLYDSTGSYVSAIVGYDENGTLLNKTEMWSETQCKYVYQRNDDGSKLEMKYYENGNTQELTRWYANGQMKQQDKYDENGESISSMSWDENGVLQTN